MIMYQCVIVDSHFRALKLHRRQLGVTRDGVNVDSPASLRPSSVSSRLAPAFDLSRTLSNCQPCALADSRDSPTSSPNSQCAISHLRMNRITVRFSNHAFMILSLAGHGHTLACYPIWWSICTTRYRCQPPHQMDLLRLQFHPSLMPYADNVVTQETAGGDISKLFTWGYYRPLLSGPSLSTK